MFSIGYSLSQNLSPIVYRRNKELYVVMYYEVYFIIE